MLVSGQAAHSPPKSSEHVVPIDGLRAVAVLSVILYHVGLPWLPGGYVGVDIFFVISGFVVTESLRGRTFARFLDLLKFFYARRLLRIMPALLVMLVATFVLAALFIPQAWLSNAIYDVGWWATIGLSNFALAANTDTYFTPRAAFNPFLHTWSLGVEEQFYLLFPAIMWLRLGPQGWRAKGKEIAIIGGLSVASLAAAGALTWMGSQSAFYSIFARFWELGAGMLLNLTMEWWRPVLAAAKKWVPLASGLAVALTAAAFSIRENAWFPFPLALLPVLGATAAIAVVTAAPGALLARALAWRPAVVIGNLSYSLYLWHWPVFVLMRWTCGLDDWRLVAIALVTVFSLAWLSYRIVEQPFRRLSKARSPQFPGRLALASLGVVAVVAAGEAVMVKHHHFISLSVTRNTAQWYPDDNTRLVPAAAKCGLTRAENQTAHTTTWRPVNCAPPVTPRGRIFLIGDSHSLAMRPLVLQFAAEHGFEVDSIYLNGCYFLSFYEPIAAWPQCDAYTHETIQKVAATAKAGDLIFLPSLRLQRLQNQGFKVEAAELTPAGRQTALDEARAATASMTRAGARLVLEAPPPIFPIPPSRCSDWFNRINSVCRPGPSISAARLAPMRDPILAAEQAVASGNPSVSVWDPFPVLCPGPVCSPFYQGKPLFSDGDHISGFGDQTVYPSFQQHMLSVLSNQP